MGFKPKSSDESAVRSLYTGIEKFKIVAVNPTMTELEAMGKNVKEEPVYTGVNDQGVAYARISFHLDNYADERGANHPVIRTNHEFYIYDKTKISSNGKVQVINKYGQSVWITPEELNTKTIPESMAAWLKADGLKAAKEGEGILVDFLRSFFNVASVATATKNGNIADAEAYISNTDALFKGDFSELRNSIDGVENKIKVLLGVKTTDEGKSYQATYNRSSLRVYMENYANFEKNLKDYKANGGASNVEFGANDFVLREYDPNLTVDYIEEASVGDFI